MYFIQFNCLFYEVIKQHCDIMHTDSIFFLLNIIQKYFSHIIDTCFMYRVFVPENFISYIFHTVHSFQVTDLTLLTFIRKNKQLQIFNTLYSLPDLIRMIKSRAMRYAEHVSCTRKNRIHTKISYGNLKERNH
jgi:hypothetical protein